METLMTYLASRRSWMWSVASVTLAAPLLAVVARSEDQSSRPPAPRDEATRARGAILDRFGPALTSAETARLGDSFSRYERQFLQFSEKHMARDRAKWELANYYDRAKIFYVYWARTGAPQYLTWANEIVVNYRDLYLAANKYQAAAHWSQMTGVLIHYMVTRDPASRTAVVSVAETMSAPYYLANLHDVNAEMDNRMQARVLSALLYAYLIESEDASPQGQRAAAKWAGRLRNALPKILQSQSADGAYRFQKIQCGYNKPFMVGLLNDALIEYFANFEKDARIVEAIRKSLDYMWSEQWDGLSHSFHYLGGSCGDEGKTPAPDLNNLIVSGFGWAFQQTGDRELLKRGDAVFAGAARAWLDGSKVFNQTYFSSYKYPAYRAMAR
jgi:hypothetical protein